MAVSESNLLELVRMRGEHSLYAQLLNSILTNFQVMSNVYDVAAAEAMEAYYSHALDMLAKLSQLNVDIAMMLDTIRDQYYESE